MSYNIVIPRGREGGGVVKKDRVSRGWHLCLRIFVGDLERGSKKQLCEFVVIMLG